MEEIYNEEPVPSLKETRRAVFLCRWFGGELDQKYHRVVAGCPDFSSFLEYYTNDNLLIKEAEPLLVENYHSKHQKLISNYIRRHGGSEEMIAKILEMHLKPLFMDYVQYKRSQLCSGISSDLQIMLVNLKDKESLLWLLEAFGDLCEGALKALVNLNDADLFRVYCTQCGTSVKSLPPSAEQLIIQLKNEEILELFFQSFYLSPETFMLLMQNEKNETLEKYFEKKSLSDYFQEQLVLCGSKKLIASYISRRSFSRNAQMQLVKKDYKDLLKLQYLKHGVDDFVVTYQAALNSFKQYLGI